jgi:hypothetical protein
MDEHYLKDSLSRSRRSPYDCRGRSMSCQTPRGCHGPQATQNNEDFNPVSFDNEHDVLIFKN